MCSIRKGLNVRKSFPFFEKDVAHYFPGHMHKGMQQMQRKLTEIDGIIEVHDARIPFTGRNENFRSTLGVRPHMLLLNKIDLTDTKYNDRVRHLFNENVEREGVNKILFSNCRKQIHSTIKNEIIPTMLDLINNSSRYHRTNCTDYNLLIIGIANVGKSSLINSLRRNHVKRGKATKVGGVAGITKSVLEKILISQQPRIYVYDTPGIMAPKITNVEVGLKLALCGTLKDHLVGNDIIADYLLYYMNKNEHLKYVDYYGMDCVTDDINVLLNQICQNNKLYVKRRSIRGEYVMRPNFERAAQLFIQSYRMGNLGLINLDENYLK